jgi:hypothetical protein
MSLFLSCFSFYRNIHVLAVACFKNILSVRALSFQNWKCYWFYVIFCLLLKLFCNIISIAVFILVVVIGRDQNVYTFVYFCMCVSYTVQMMPYILFATKIWKPPLPLTFCFFGSISRKCPDLLWWISGNPRVKHFEIIAVRTLAPERVYSLLYRPWGPTNGQLLSWSGRIVCNRENCFGTVS